jgi:hypothetical protein
MAILEMRRTARFTSVLYSVEPSEIFLRQPDFASKYFALARRKNIPRTTDAEGLHREYEAGIGIGKCSRT